ncbi:MAG: hypothetical protein ABR586_08730 [Thermoplasmatota archaeon]
MTPRLLCLLALAPLLAGCFDACDPQPPVSARGVGASTPSSGGDGGALATLTVTQEPGGPGLADAGVVFFWGDEDSAAALRGERPVVHVGAEAGSASAEVDVGTGGPAPPAYTTTLPLRTGPDGTVTARLPKDRIVGVVAAADGWTEEWIPAFATGSAGEAALRLPLYRERLEVDLTGTLDRASASTALLLGNSQAQWYPQDVQLGKATGATAGYLARLVSLDATLNWSNEPLSFGDLALAVGPAGGEPAVVQDSSGDVAPGDRTQSLTLDGDRLGASGLPGARHLLAGPATRTAYVGPLGVPYKLHLTLTMDRAQAFRSQCDGTVDVHAGAHASPAAGLLLAVGLLGTASLARRRR